jgi:hypothetical protein
MRDGLTKMLILSSGPKTCSGARRTLMTMAVKVRVRRSRKNITNSDTDFHGMMPVLIFTGV